MYLCRKLEFTFYKFFIYFLKRVTLCQSVSKILSAQLPLLGGMLQHLNPVCVCVIFVNMYRYMISTEMLIFSIFLSCLSLNSTQGLCEQ